MFKLNIFSKFNSEAGSGARRANIIFPTDMAVEAHVLLRPGKQISLESKVS